MNQELAKEGIPLPFGNRFWSSNWPTQTAPFPGLLMNLVVTVSNHTSLSRNRSHSVLCEVIVIIAPPQKVAYPFILDLSGYPFQIIYLFVVLVSILLFLPPDPTINLKTGLFLSSLGKAQYTTAIQRHLSQLALSTNLKLTGLCSVAPSSILLPSCHPLLCVSKYLSCHIPQKTQSNMHHP